MQSRKIRRSFLQCAIFLLDHRDSDGRDILFIFILEGKEPDFNQRGGRLGGSSFFSSGAICRN